jgi:hypothetical protein
MPEARRWAALAVPCGAAQVLTKPMCWGGHAGLGRLSLAARYSGCMSLRLHVAQAVCGTVAVIELLPGSCQGSSTWKGFHVLALVSPVAHNHLLRELLCLQGLPSSCVVPCQGGRAAGAMEDNVFGWADRVFNRIPSIVATSEPGPGPRPIFDKAGYEQSMTTDGKYLGTANNLFRLDMTRPAVANQKFSIAEISKYGDDHWSVPKALEAGRNLEWRHPIAVACASKTDPGANPSQDGLFRKISMDIQVFSFLLCWNRWLSASTSGHAGETAAKAQEMFQRAALHVPMDYYFFESNADYEENVFIKSVQLMEDFRKDEEEFAPGGWQMCCLFAQARLMQCTALSSLTLSCFALLS